MSAPAVCALFISSPRADYLQEWYRAAFDADENEHGGLVFGEVDLYIESHSDITGRTAEPARMMICLNIEDFTSVEDGCGHKACASYENQKPLRSGSWRRSRTETATSSS
jgi:hypothetical protein